MRWIYRGVLALAALAVTLVVLAFFLPAERVAGLAAQQFRAATGRSLTIGGAVHARFFPQLGVRAEAVAVGNADWAGGDPMLRAESLDIGLDLLSLLKGDLRIAEVELLAPDIVLERAADGRVNWDFGAGQPGDGTGGTTARPSSLDSVAVQGGRLRFVDHASGDTTELTDIAATLTAPDFRSAAVLDLSAAAHGQPFTLSGRIAEVAPFLAGQVVPVDLTLTSGATRVALSGRFGTGPLAAEGRVDAELGDLSALFRLAGRARPALPAELAGDVRFAGDVTLTAENSLHLRSGVLKLGANTLGLAADLTPGPERPKLTAKATTTALSLPAMAGGGGADGGGGKDGWSRDPIDVSGLFALDADLALSADRIGLGTLVAGPAQLTLSLDNGRAVTTFRDVAAYSGTLSGNYVVNGRGGLSTGGALSLKGVALKPLLTDATGFQRLIGTGDMTIDFLASGNSQAALVENLKGSGQLALTNGQIEGLDLVGMLSRLDTSYVGEGAKTIFDSITASFRIDRGRVTNDDLDFSSPLLTASGAGTVDLPAQSLDYRVVPRALAKADGSGGVTVPLRIHGPWSDLAYALDLEAAANARLDKERKKAEEKLKARAAEELGIAPKDGEDLEDAARRRLEEEAAKALGKLLGGN